VYLQDGAGTRYFAGDPLPAGRLTIMALFEGSEFRDAGAVQVTAGQAIEIVCTRFETCAAR